jgi:hypothetical protein
MSAGLAFRTGKAVARKYSIFLTVQFPMMKQRLQVDSANDAVEQVQRDLVRAYAKGEIHRD